MTRLLLIHAGPTPWDIEDRLVGNHPLPLADLARATIDGVVRNLPHAVSAIYRCRKNEACDQAARIVATALKLRVHDSAALDELNLGLWQGLTRSELRFRFPTVFPVWEENPLSVLPPDAEPLEAAMERLREGLKRILRRNRGVAIVLPMRPLSMQIMLGLLRREELPAIAGHLHNTAAIETIDIPDEELYQFIG